MTSKKSATTDLLKKVAAEGQKLPIAERRNFLKNGLMLAGGMLAGAAANAKASDEDQPQNLPPNLPQWS